MYMESICVSVQVTEDYDEGCAKSSIPNEITPRGEFPHADTA